MIVTIVIVPFESTVCPTTKKFIYLDNLHLCITFDKQQRHQSDSSVTNTNILPFQSRVQDGDLQV